MKQKLLVVLMGLGLMTFIGCKGGNETASGSAAMNSVKSISPSPSTQTVTLTNATVSTVWGFQHYKYDSATQKYGALDTRPDLSARLIVQTTKEKLAEVVSAYEIFLGLNYKVSFSNLDSFPKAYIMNFFISFEKSGDMLYASVAPLKDQPNSACIVVATEKQVQASLEEFVLGIEGVKRSIQEETLARASELLVERLGSIDALNFEALDPSLSLKPGEDNVIVLVNVKGSIDLTDSTRIVFIGSNIGDLSKLHLAAVEGAIVLVDTTHADFSGEILGATAFIAKNVAGKIDVLAKDSTVEILNSFLKLTLRIEKSQFYAINSLGDLEVVALNRSKVEIVDSAISGAMNLDGSNVTMNNVDGEIYANTTNSWLNLLDLSGVTVAANTGGGYQEISNASDSTISFFTNDSFNLSGGSNNLITIVGTGYSYDLSTLLKSWGI